MHLVNFWAILSKFLEHFFTYCVLAPVELYMLSSMEMYL